MNSEEIRKIIDDVYDDSREDSIRSMIRDFYGWQMGSYTCRIHSTAVFIWVAGLLFFAGAIYSGIRFFGADQTRDQIMYAAGFICCVYLVGLVKIFAWQMLHRKNIKREIKRLELRIAELAKSLDKTAQPRPKP